MKFVLRLVLALFSGIVLGGMTIKEEKTQFIYLNNPETLKTTGILHKKKYSQNTNVRYFFHFKNGTNNAQNFYIKSQFIISNFKIAYHKHKRPEIAGAISTTEFMKLNPWNQQVDLTLRLNPNETISGIAEGRILKDDVLLFQFGNQKNIIRTVEQTQTSYQHNINIDLNNNKNAKYRLGENIENTVKGQYGNNISIFIKPLESGILSLKFSPRGGNGLLVFENRGKIYKTDIKPAYDKYDVMLVYVEKNKIEKFTFIPLGGLNYPIELDFSLKTEILKEATLQT